MNIIKFLILGLIIATQTACSATQPTQPQTVVPANKQDLISNYDLAFEGAATREDNEKQWRWVSSFLERYPRLIWASPNENPAIRMAVSSEFRASKETPRVAYAYLSKGKHALVLVSLWGDAQWSAYHEGDARVEVNDSYSLVFYDDNQPVDALCSSIMNADELKQDLVAERGETPLHVAKKFGSASDLYHPDAKQLHSNVTDTTIGELFASAHMEFARTLSYKQWQNLSRQIGFGFSSAPNDFADVTACVVPLIRIQMLAEL